MLIGKGLSPQVEADRRFGLGVEQRQQEVIQLMEKMKIYQDRDLTIVMLVYLAGKIADDYLHEIDVEGENSQNLMTGCFVSSVIFCNDRLRMLIGQGLSNQDCSLKLITVLELLTDAEGAVARTRQTRKEELEPWANTLDQGIAFLQARTFSQFSRSNSARA